MAFSSASILLSNFHELLHGPVLFLSLPLLFYSLASKLETSAMLSESGYWFMVDTAFV
jgi:hypothetical protein